MNKPLDTIHMIGGGIQNELLCQFTADATDRVVTTGPVEATALGNVIMQMLALGKISSLAQGREVIRRSFGTKQYAPHKPDAWDEAYGRFQALCGK